EEVRLVERLEHVHPRAREERAHHLEGWVLGRRADEGERSIFEIRQEGVLLSLVETMYFVEEQHGRPPAHLSRRARMLDGGAYVLHACHDGRQCDELRICAPGDEARECRLARAGRSPKEH